eukprot:4403403-Pyramimonas_sp.AAC.1
MEEVEKTGYDVEQEVEDLCTRELGLTIELRRVSEWLRKRKRSHAKPLWATMHRMTRFLAQGHRGSRTRVVGKRGIEGTR